VTFHGEIYRFINFRRVPLAEIYCLIIENFRTTYADGAGESSSDAKSVCGGVEIGGVAVLPALTSRRVGWVPNETAEARFGGDIHTPTQWLGSLSVVLGVIDHRNVLEHKAPQKNVKRCLFGDGARGWGRAMVLR
jgi:hypothetical protein